ncbi:MAG: glycosyltransferase [Bacteroidales bacterium]
MKKICVSVTNDLVTDQRVLKVCDTLLAMGFSVKLIGRRRKGSKDFAHPAAESFRFRMLFHKGFLFYAEYNLKLFFYLLFQRCDILLSNDLDTLLPNYLVAKLKRKPLVYDSHEYFTGSTEIVNRPFVKGVWHFIEKRIFPGLKHVFTVNHSIADLYEKEYGVRPRVVRNLPRLDPDIPQMSRHELGWPMDKKIILMQGGAINVDRGAEELIYAMKPCYGLKDVELYFIGGGDVWEQLQKLTADLHLQRVVRFIPRMPYLKLMQYTAQADLGVSLDKPVSPNYRYSLPNKLFDYIMMGVPVLTSSLVEVKNIVKKYDVGDCIETHDPAVIAAKIKLMLNNEEQLKQWKANARRAALELNWQNEEGVLKEVYAGLL